MASVHRHRPPGPLRTCVLDATEPACVRSVGDHKRALDAQRAWIVEHGSNAERVVVIDQEQRRRAVDKRAVRLRAASLDGEPDPWSHVPVRPDRNLSIER